MASVVLELWVELVDTETGLWCPRCALPSGIRVTFAQYPTADTVAPSRLWSLTGCRDCGEREGVG